MISAISWVRQRFAERKDTEHGQASSASAWSR